MSDVKELPNINPPKAEDGIDKQVGESPKSLASEYQDFGEQVTGKGDVQDPPITEKRAIGLKKNIQIGSQLETIKPEETVVNRSSVDEPADGVNRRQIGENRASDLNELKINRLLDTSPIEPMGDPNK